MLDVAELARAVREDRARLAPEAERRPRRPAPDPQARAVDKRGREIERGDPILFAAAGPASGVYAGRYLGRDPSSGRMIAQIDQGEPRAGERAAILAGSTIRARGEDIRAEAKAAIARELHVLAGDAL
jgi:hypothetical protein